MNEKKPEDISEDTKQIVPLEAEASNQGVRRLTEQERLEFDQDMVES